MDIERIEGAFTVCKVGSVSDIPQGRYTFTAITDEEISLVCPSENVPENTLERSDGWRAFRVKGTLDFSLVGILAKIAGALADEGISLFAVSTYNTDYILVSAENYERAVKLAERNML